MEQYLNLIWKNYTISISEDSDENNDTIDLFIDNDLQYKIPFWIGVTVIIFLFLFSIIATIRYCIYTLFSTQKDVDKVALVPTNTIQHRKTHLTNPIEDQKVSIVPIHRDSKEFRRKFNDIYVLPVSSTFCIETKKDCYKNSSKMKYRTSVQASQDDCLEHAWPKPPESMTTSEMSGTFSISYDHLARSTTSKMKQSDT